MQFYEVTEEKKYLQAALHCADALAARIRPGDEGHSPWPFRVDAKTGAIIREEYCANVIGPIRLFDELLRLQLGHVSAYKRARALAIWRTSPFCVPNRITLEAIVSIATTSKNPAALLNLTVLGGFLVPGSQCDALFVMQGGLVDVNNGCLYASVESEGSARIYRPTFVIEKEGAIAKAKSEAVKNFGTGVVSRIRSVRDSMPPAVPPMDAVGPIQEIDPKTGQLLSK